MRFTMDFFVKLSSLSYVMIEFEYGKLSVDFEVNIMMNIHSTNESKWYIQ